MKFFKKYFVGVIFLFVLGSFILPSSVESASEEYIINGNPCLVLGTSPGEELGCGIRIIFNRETPGQEFIEFYMQSNSHHSLNQGNGFYQGEFGPSNPPNTNIFQVRFGGQIANLFNDFNCYDGNCLRAKHKPSIPTQNGCYSIPVFFRWAYDGELNPQLTYQYTVRLPYKVGNVTCKNHDSHSVGDMSLVSVASPAQVVLGNNSFIHYFSSNTTSCKINRIDNNNIIATIANRCPTIGTIDTGPLPSGPTEDKLYRYQVSCGTGTHGFSSPLIENCTGFYIGGAVSVEKIEKNNFAILNYYNQLRYFISKIVPRAMAVPNYPGATVEILSKYTPPPITFNFIKEPGKEKNLVKANVVTNENIGKVFFQYRILNKPTDVTCKLKNTTNENKPKLLLEGGTFSTDDNNLSPNNNNFRIQCVSDNNPNIIIAQSNILSASGQSGTINTPANCIIPLNGSSCNISVPWSVESPRVGTQTTIETQGNTVYTSGGGSNSNGTASITLNGSAYLGIGNTSNSVPFSLLNKVDGTNSSTSVNNTIETKNVNIICAAGFWNGTICSQTAINGPDLTVLPPFSPYSAKVNTQVNLQAIVKNQGNASTGSSFNNFFQYSTVDPMSGTSGTGGTAKGLRIFNLFAKKVDAGATPPTGIQTLFDLPSVLLSPILAGGQATLSHTTTFNKTGMYWIRACSDKANRNDMGTITESNENNNCSDWNWTLNIYSGEMPDLIAGVPVISETDNNFFGNEVGVGMSRILTSTIGNIGNVSTGSSFYNFFQYSTVDPMGGVPGGNGELTKDVRIFNLFAKKVDAGELSCFSSRLSRIFR